MLRGRMRMLNRSLLACADYLTPQGIARLGGWLTSCLTQSYITDVRPEVLLTLGGWVVDAAPSQATMSCVRHPRFTVPVPQVLSIAP